MNNNNTVHPIEFFIACLINLVEFIAWTINEIAGFHVPSTQPTTPATTPTTRKQQTTTFINKVKSLNEDWTDYVTTLTVKQLRTLTGITNSRFNKAHLIEAALTY